ncbi:MAG: hypothetical protein DRJ64_00675 [Thermoprotei archaeon]|nr:MAG: hypothetical protein DRJ64_00675 [Thermoprotei archaeon]
MTENIVYTAKQYFSRLSMTAIEDILEHNDLYMSLVGSPEPPWLPLTLEQYSRMLDDDDIKTIFMQHLALSQISDLLTRAAQHYREWLAIQVEMAMLKGEK